MYQQQADNWIDLHALWVALSQHNIPGDQWTYWNRYARRHGVKETLTLLKEERG